MFIFPNYKIENELYRQGYRNIAGLDEAGRGAWAGPVVAAAVVLPPKLKIKGLRDSKLLSLKQREELFVVIKKNALAIGVGIVSEKTIDSEGIIGATRRAFLAAAEKIKEQVEYLLVDGIKFFGHYLPTSFYIKGDRKIISIAAASIVAKVTRDCILIDYHKEYPLYGFDQHKGYGTAQHMESLEKHGPCAIHRQSFRPIFELGKERLED
ncbi:ribonuclease HII [Candidatus Kuenenbacteria bacterium RIFCSPLOWO2_12_FULL_42_13]|uniref:Ribonuclease HII n=3 Tax=Candidatus Kueneniibacteriota TaxID=1752740 RepID=A0A0G0Z3C0_9BACT|nr:MAG: Ribonuclease HII [Candidatus Kuenenbacteria bacterium GW2011_GWA2_42_15]OGG89489.1 MAG: ribonuclease HII [Candidatus Kuenenbacteria bacterium RIFCSPHIGHO2_02_FULL_42_29]OGG90620.1 MAG: ribonuclease HII [Candidatus Kuenenbacteria bacterium RIFCSPLOWO2_02_FULL_42_16]OGG92449.1 MAG: ribonuclease HII [Candidatus Kuenenbacteria bacterium RIFCSPLOWO2_12_FULL_42_13]